VPTEEVKRDHHVYDVPLLKIPMGRGRSGEVAPPPTQKQLRDWADELCAGERCIHCNKEIIDIDNTILVREGLSDARIHLRCVDAFIASGPVDWLNRDTVPRSHFVQSADGDRLYVRIDGQPGLIRIRRRKS